MKRPNKRGPKPKAHEHKREACVGYMREGYSLLVIERASGVPNRVLTRWRNEEGIEPSKPGDFRRRQLSPADFIRGNHKAFGFNEPEGKL